MPILKKNHHFQIIPKKIVSKYFKNEKIDYFKKLFLSKIS